ncbi:MAG TPA: M20/M25/M40 family metallo-hydrolase [Thermoanaerobaculia bacterium]|nr:M20/M25/M40 family metallo-hydrolase [Thermoanaerobaculia bacterium]
MSDSADAARRRRHRNERIVATMVVLLFAGAAAWIVQWSRNTREELSGAYVPRVTEITPEIRMLQEYVRIDTSTPAGAAAGARWLAAQLRARGIEPELIQSAPDRLNVYARIRGRRPGEGLLLFNHIDVVPPGGEWTHPPFAANIAFNQMYGRGTVDMKGVAICQLLAFADLARTTPEHDVVFLATADEETGSTYGMKWLLEHRPDVFANIRYGITEGGITEMMTERMTYFGIEVGGKQFVELEAEGEDVESMRKARFALEPYMFPREAERVLPEVRRYFRDIAPTRYAFRPLLADIDKTIADGKFWILPEPYRDVTQNTVWASAPLRRDGRWMMIIRLVNLPDERPAERIAAIAKIIEPYGLRVARVNQQEGPVPFSTDQTRLFAILRDEARRRYHVDAGVIVLYRSTSDARFLRPRGIVCYGISPFPVNYYQSRSIHNRDERIQLDAFMEGIGYMRGVVAEWAAGAA